MAQEIKKQGPVASLHAIVIRSPRCVRKWIACSIHFLVAASLADHLG